MTWHVDHDLVNRYARGALPDTTAWSVEVHLTACGSCRSVLDSTPAAAGDPGGVDDARLAQIWGGVRAQIRAAQRPISERLLVRLGVADHTARLLAATPSLTVSWLSGVAVVLALGVVAAWLADPGASRLLPFLLLAPLVPVAGVAAGFGPGVDPTYDLARIAPMSSWRLLVTRSVAVLATSVLLAALGALSLPEISWMAAGWLVPSLAMSTSVLALSTRWTPLVAASSVAGGWLTVVVALERHAWGQLLAFGVAGQLVMAGVLVVTLAVFLRTREAVDPAVRP
jgi:Putative zinc-finger